MYRCRTRDLEDETKELKEKLTEVEDLLRRTEAQRQELERLNEFNKKEHSAALAAATTKVRSCSSLSWYGPHGVYTLQCIWIFKAEHVIFMLIIRFVLNRVDLPFLREENKVLTLLCFLTKLHCLITHIDMLVLAVMCPMTFGRSVLC